MANTIDGVEININMVWAERYQSDRVVQSVKHTLGEVPVVYSAAVEKGQPITLVATIDSGWITRSVVDSLITRAAVPGAIYILSFNGTNYSVIFRNDEPPAVDMEPLVARTADDAADWFIGQIKLRKV